MTVQEIPANELTIMTPELYQEFCQGGCVPACHFTNEWICIGDMFSLSTVKEWSGYLFHENEENKFKDIDVMLSSSSTVEEYNKRQISNYEEGVVKYHDKKKGGCFRVNGKIVL